MKNKLIIFDLDGVIIDSQPLAEKNFFALHPSATREDMMDILCGNYHDEIEKYSHLMKKETIEERDIRWKKYAEDKSKVPMFDGMGELIEELHKKGHILVINTSTFARNVTPLLVNLKVDKLFDFVATEELSKSKAEKFKLIKERYKVENDEMIFITDTLGDIKEAKKANVPTVAVTWGAHDRSYFVREKHKNLVAIVDTVKELGEFIDAQN